MTKSKIFGIIFLVILLTYFGVGYIHYQLNKPGHKDFLQLNFEDEWEYDWMDGGDFEICCGHSLQVIEEKKSNNHVLRFELNSTDDNVKGRKRVELRRKAVRQNEEHWYSFKMLIPDNWIASSAPTTVAQWHAVPEILLTEYGRPPPLRLLIVNDEWVIVNIWDENRISRKLPLFNDSSKNDGKILWSNPVERGVWASWVFHIKWSFTGKGLVEVWKDSSKIITHTGSNNYNDMLAPYFKIGIYIPGWPENNKKPKIDKREIYVDEISINGNHQELIN